MRIFKKPFLLIIILLPLCLAFCLLLSSSSRSFWDQLGVPSDSIDEIHFSYRDQSIPLDQFAMNQFIHALSQSEPARIEENHEFTPSDIDVTFLSGNQKVQVTFYWFPYIAKLEGFEDVMIDASETESFYPLIGNRFDAVINGKKYHYRFTSSDVWTEEMAHSSYNRIASVNHFPTTAKIDGCDRGYTQAGLFSAKPYTLNEILSESSLIFLGTYEGDCRRKPYTDASYTIDWDRFYIQEILKGTSESLWYELPTDRKGSFFQDAWNRMCAAYPAVYAPNFQTDEVYLICCIQNSEGYDQYFGQYSTAVLEDGVLFPRFNTEDHPFYNISLQEVRQRLKEVGLSRE